MSLNAEGGAKEGGEASCESCCTNERSCVGGAPIADDGMLVVSILCVVGGFGNGN